MASRNTFKQMAALQHLKSHSLSYNKFLKPKFISGNKDLVIRTCHTLPAPNGYCDVKTFYKDRNVLVTGATGFLGKVLVEKLLRSCSEIGNVYVLIRPKRGHDTQKRMDQLLNSKIFDRLKVEQPATIGKLIAISGDIIEPHLGIDERDERTLIDKVSVVFHSAATVNFNEELRKAVQLNAGGTLNIIKLCHKLQHLEAFIDVSTAFANFTLKDEVEERVYPLCKNPLGLVRAFNEKWMTDEMVKALSPILIGEWPNTYTYTKALAENITLSECKNLQAAIIRPSAIVSSIKEPYPGWVDSTAAVTGVQLAAMKGLLRACMPSPNNKIDCVPADVCVNMMIAAAWHLAKTKSKEIPVYHCSSGNVQSFTYGQLGKAITISARKFPVNTVLWYPKLSIMRTRLYYEICVICFQYLPAIVADAIFRLSGKKLGLFKIQKKLSSTIRSFGHFSANEWKFNTGNLYKLWDAMSTEDKRVFDFDMRQINWSTFYEASAIGIKLYLLNEDMASLPAARKRLQRLLLIRNITYLLGILGGGGFLGIIYTSI